MSNDGSKNPNPEKIPSFRKWIMENYRRLVGFAGSLQHKRDPEDQVQSLFVRVHERPSRFRGWIRSYTAFAFKMLRNIAYNEARRARRERHTAASGAELASPDQSPADRFAESEERALLARAIAYLTQIEQEWVAAIQGGLDGTELAQRFGVSHAAARKRKQSIRQRLSDGVMLLRRIDTLGSPPGSVREQVICLHYLGRLKPAEIAGHRQCSIDFVMQLLNEANGYLPAGQGHLVNE
jgi:RNA polymerase sigma factor (sigma-70 family)